MKGFSNPSGRLVRTDEGYDSFIPNRLPPKVDLAKLIFHINEASNLVGTLNGFGKKLPNPHLLIRPQLMKEAVQSSKIEGSQVSLSDLYRYQIGIRESKDALIDSEEVNNYVDALEMALKRVADGEAIDLKLLNECHKMLLRGVRGGETSVGGLRRKQNWIGTGHSDIWNATYVPPIPSKVSELMDDLIGFMEDPPRDCVPLIQCAIVHYQFETIHPYEDGNGRIGRLLIPLMLADRALLSVPLLYLSGYMEQNKARYYELLMNVRSRSEWVEWINFFLSAVISQAQSSISLIERLDALHEEYRSKTDVGPVSGTVIKIIDLIFQTPILTRRRVEDKLGVSNATAKRGIDRLVEIGILKHVGVVDAKNMYIAKEVYNLISS